MNRIIRLIASILLCQMAGIVGSLFTMPSIPTWYASLAKPWFSPPNWLFGPVWITLYLLMGIALYLAWNKGLEKKGAKRALSVFGIQLFLNALWSFLFFGLLSPLLGLIGIVILWIAILASIILFWGIDRRAGIILIPYIVWVTIATLLNLYILLLN
jgi:benzodiazapine receptor